MSRTLDKLILAHKQKLGQMRRYSSEVDKTAIDNAFNELDNALEALREQLKVESDDPLELAKTLGDDEYLGDLLALESKEYEGFEKDLVTANDKEKSSYRYRILPRLYSQLEEIDSSPQLARKLISYYLRNRRKEKMYRLYGRITNRVMADHLLHEIYMELGRTLYFSWLSDVKEYVKNKIRDIKILRVLREAIEKLRKLGSELIERLVQINVEIWLARLLAGGVGAAMHLILKAIGIYAGAIGLGGYISTAIAYGLAGVAFLVGVIAVAIMAYFIFRTIITKYRIILRPKALLTFVKGYNLLKRFVQAFSKLWDDISVGNIIEVLGTFVKAAKDGDNASTKSIMERIEDIVKKINSNKDYAAFFTTLNQAQIGKLKEAQEQGEKLTVKFEAQVAKGFANIIKEKFKVPAFIMSNDIDLAVGVETEQPAQDSEESRHLPIELVMLLIITSPNVTITLSAGKERSSITFKSWEFVKNYGKVTEAEVKQFLELYMMAFANKRYELSKYLMGKYEEKVSLNE
jgi:hypothetical protein